MGNGPGHAEVKMEADGPCLVEVGARCHGWSGTWLSLVNECVGPHNQVQVTMDVYLDNATFDALPCAPSSLLKHGTCVMLVSREEGTLSAVDTKLLETLPSFHKATLWHCVGKRCSARVCKSFHFPVEARRYPRGKGNISLEGRFGLCRVATLFCRSAFAARAICFFSA